MTDNSRSQEEREIQSQVAEVRGRLEGLASELRLVDDELEGLAPRRRQHELLAQACASLEELGRLGAGDMFWGEGIEEQQVGERIREVRSRVDTFQVQLDQLDERRQSILERIGREEEGLEILADDLYQAREAEERRKLEWLVERDVSPIPARLQVMAWARGGEDDRRFRRSLAASLLASLILGLLFPMINLPAPRRPEGDDALPRRIAQFIRQAQARPTPPPTFLSETLSDQEAPEPQEPEPPEDQPEPSEQPLQPEPEAVAAAAPEPSAVPGPIVPEAPVGAPPGPPEREVATAGILAFRDQFASLSQDRVAPRLGADARLSEAEEASRATSASRSMLTSNTPGSSGGIDSASLSRSVGGGSASGGGGGAGGTGGSGLAGVDVGRATSSIAGIGGGDRPRATGGPGLSRTDEEIQIVFDRHKAEFYRFYNRELRNNPALQGQMVLRLTIEPDGSVSMCVLQSTDMDAPNLAAQVLNRVRTIDFGAKDVQAMTIVYPIDFLPASEG